MDEEDTLSPLGGMDSPQKKSEPRQNRKMSFRAGNQTITLRCGAWGGVGTPRGARGASFPTRMKVNNALVCPEVNC